MSSLKDKLKKSRFTPGIKHYLIAGLLVWVPLGITVWVLSILITSMDSLLAFLPDDWQPVRWLGFSLPGFGVILVLVILFVTGVLTANFLGERLLEGWERLLNRIPFVKSIYSGVKQVSETVLVEKGKAFHKALLVEFPKAGSWTVAFQTGNPTVEIADTLKEPHVSVYVPTTPNPTSGYFIIVPLSSVVELEMTVDEALKYVVSMGVIEPKPKVKNTEPQN
jgi:uncharacterized membrane protein